MDRQRIRNAIGGCPVETATCADNLAIALCTYFEEHQNRPDPDPADGDHTWGAWVEDQTNKALDSITDAVLRAVGYGLPQEPKP